MRGFPNHHAPPSRLPILVLTKGLLPLPITLTAYSYTSRPTDTFGVNRASGNYTTFCAQVEAEEKIQMKLYEKQQADMAKLADYVEANHANGKARSAASKDKVLTKIKGEAVLKPKLKENTFTFEFPED